MTETPIAGSLNGRITELQEALITSTGHAEGASGRITIDCTADGLIRDWHIDDALRGGDIRAVITALVGLQHQAVEQARQKVRGLADQLLAHPEFTGLGDTLDDALNQPIAEQSVAAQRDSNEGDDIDRRPSIFEDPVGRARRLH